MENSFPQNVKKQKGFFLRIALMAVIFCLLPLSGSVHAAEIPETGFVSPVQLAYVGGQNALTTNLPSLDVFTENLINGEAEQIVGVYQEFSFAQRVVQQPDNDAAYVSPFDNQMTQFHMVDSMTGNVGLLAHNYLSGKLFFELEPEEVVQVVYGDGSVQAFKIEKSLSYQAVSPQDVYSNFVDLETGKKLTAAQLFERVYGGSYHLTFQTCIRNGDEYSWGRLFVIATPVEL
jgi:hypothetical protein